MSMDKHYVDCVRQRKTQTLNDNGRPISSYIDTSIRGYLGRQTDKVVIVADKPTIETQIKFFTSDWEIQYNDRIVYEGNIYEVVGEPKNTDHRNDHIKIMVKKIANIKQ
jgi:hypothetical protein